MKHWENEGLINYAPNMRPLPLQEIERILNIVMEVGNEGFLFTQKAIDLLPAMGNILALAGQHENAAACGLVTLRSFPSPHVDDF